MHDSKYSRMVFNSFHGVSQQSTGTSERTGIDAARNSTHDFTDKVENIDPIQLGEKAGQKVSKFYYLKM